MELTDEECRNPTTAMPPVCVSHGELLKMIWGAPEVIVFKALNVALALGAERRRKAAIAAVKKLVMSMGETVRIREVIAAIEAGEAHE